MWQTHNEVPSQCVSSHKISRRFLEFHKQAVLSIMILTLRPKSLISNLRSQLPKSPTRLYFFTSPTSQSRISFYSTETSSTKPSNVTWLIKDSGIFQHLTMAYKFLWIKDANISTQLIQLYSYKYPNSSHVVFLLIYKIPDKTNFELLSITKL